MILYKIFKSRLLKTIFNADENAIFLLDSKNKIIYQNSAAASLLKKQKQSSKNTKLTLRLKSKSNVPEDLQDYIRKTLETKKPQVTKDLFLIREKKEIPTKITFSPIENIGVTVKIEDYSAEYEKAQIQEEFVSLASHEMRTPIAAAEGYIDLALNPNVSKIDEKARSCLDMAKQSIKNLSELFYNILDTSRLENNDLRANFTTISLNDFIEKLSLNYKILAEKSQQSFSVSFQSEDPVYCNTDPTYLQESIDNLVSNAIKYTKKGGRVSISVAETSKQIDISVTDDGVGIAKSELPKIFQKFYRINENETQVRGTGLGLYITKKRVEKINGKISVKSVPNQGSTFTISLPKPIKAKSDSSQPEKVQNKKIKPLSEKDLLDSDQLYKNYLDLKKFPNIPPQVTTFPFMELTSDWKEGKVPSSSEEEINNIYSSIQKENPNIPKQKLDRYLVPFRKNLENPGLAKMLSSFVSKSRFFIPWILASPDPLSWDIAFGWGEGLDGEWQKIPMTDDMYHFIIRSPSFIWVRYRSVLTRREIENKQNVLFLNAGSLSEIHYVNHYKLPGQITACDSRPNIDLENIPNWPTSLKSNIKYVKQDAFSFLDQENLKKSQFDAIIMNGGGLYYYSDIERIIQMAAKVLKPGGFFMFDVQISHWALIRAAYIFGIYPHVVSVPSDTDTILKRVSKFCEKNWGLSVEYLKDPINEEPTSIMLKVIKQ